jgi:hypothetical protein
VVRGGDLVGYFLVVDAAVLSIEYATWGAAFLAAEAAFEPEAPIVNMRARRRLEIVQKTNFLC